MLRSLHFKLVFEFCSRKSALEFSSYRPPSCHVHLQGKPWDPWGQCPMQKFSSPADGKVLGHFHGQGRKAEALEVPSVHCFFCSSVTPLPPPPSHTHRGLSFPQCCVSHVTELSSLHPSLPNRIASDMLIFASSSIFTSVHFQKECLACHRVHSLMIKTEALAVHMPTSDPIPCP